VGGLRRGHARELRARLAREAPLTQDRDVAVVGGGILGLACARELLLRRPGASLVVLEREAELGSGQTGTNSGVIHSGVYYSPGSLKARLCVEGARLLYDYCGANGIAAERCGKLIVARDAGELPALDELERRGRANGVPGLRRITASAIAAIEPHATGVAALHSPATGIVDFGQVARALAADVEHLGGAIERGRAVTGIGSDAAGVALTTPSGQTRARRALFCAGHAADRLAVMAGAPPDPRIVPFRGSYLRLRPERESLVRGLIYPVPDPRLPFLGVHLTRHPLGGVLIGPTALLLPRARSLAWPGTWRMAARFWRSGLTELSHAVSRRRMVTAAASLVPGLTVDDVEPAWSGARAQALGRDGTLVEDFVFSQTGPALHVRNAPSPAATSSLAIARLIADRFEQL
jgi:2-hydroxyglutarate dehydrogenase